LDIRVTAYFVRRGKRKKKNGLIPSHEGGEAPDVKKKGEASEREFAVKSLKEVF